MSEFNIDFFRPVQVPSGNDQKQDQVSAASAAKKALLEAKHDAARVVQAEQEYARMNSWAGKLGMESGSFISNRVNDAASIVSGASRMAGDILSLPTNALAAGQTYDATDSDYAAFERVKNGSNDPLDKQLAKQFENAEKLRNISRSTKNFFDLSGIVDQTNRNSLSSDLGEDFEKNWGKVTAGWKDGKPSGIVSGIAGLLMNAGESVVTNPSAAREYILENAPQLFTGALGVGGKVAMAASNVGYAADNYRQGLEEYAAKNGGALPPEAERTRMALYAATLAGAEQVGDMVGLGVAKLAGKSATDVVKTSALQSLKNTLKAGGTAGVTEAGTEGYQTFAEGEVTGKPAAAQDAYTGAVIGAVAGSGLSGGARALAEITKATPEHLNEQADAAIKAASFDAAVADNKPDAFLDEKSPDYNPAAAVRVINEMTKKEAVTPEQAKENVKKSGEIIAKLEDAKAQSSKTEAKRNPEYIKQLQSEIAQVEQAINAADTPELKADFSEELGLMQDELADLTDKQRILQRQNRMTSLDRKLSEAREAHHGLVRMTNPGLSKTEVDTNITSADSSDADVSSKAGDVLLNLSMAAPDDLDPTVAKTLADNKNNGLTPVQRDQLRYFSEARLAENELKTMSAVSQEILYGQNKPMGNVGIAQYRTRIAAAVASQNKESAERDLALLAEFASSHAGKLKAMQQATKGAQIIRVGDNWEINTGKRMSDKAIKENGGLTLNSPKLLDYVSAEAKALTAAHTQLSKAVALHFGGAAVQSVPSPATPTNISSNKSEEEETRPEVNSEPIKAETPKKEKKTVLKGEEKQARLDAILARAKANPNNGGVARTQASPSATSPVAVSADATTAPATALASAENNKENTTPATEPEATQQPAAVSEANPAPVAEVATATEENIFQDTGMLSVMASRLESAGKSMHALFMEKGFNPIAQFLKQKPTSEQFDTMRPLVKEKNFLSQWLARNVLPAEFLGFQPDADQQKALAHFATMARKMNPVIAENIPTDTVKDVYSLRDMMAYMVGADGIDENTLTAMSFGVYHAMLQRANSPAKTPEQLNLMHGRDKDAVIGGKAWTTLDGVWDIEDTAVADLGRTALQALGLTARKDAPQNILPLLQTALGTHMITVMEKANLVERRPLNTKEINDSFEPIEGQEIDAKKFTMYVFPNPAALPAFKQINKGTGSVVEKLFGADPAVRFADTKPAPFKQEFAQHTKQAIPRILSKVLNKAQQVPHMVIPDMWEVVNGLGADNVLKVAGFRDPNVNVHAANMKSVEAKNNGLKRQLELAMEMIGGDITKKFFVQFEVWKNFRVGVTTDSLNQQTSKIHRYLFARPSWTVTIDMGNVEQRIALEVAIAAGLGIKTDDQPNEDTTELLREKWNSDADLRAAVEAMHLGLTTGDWSGADAITKYAAGAEGMMTLQTLQTYARYQNADASGKLEVTLLTGADGKTNGPILTHLALGASSDADSLMERMARGGVYTHGEDKPRHYSQWRKDNAGKDLYQDLADHLIRLIGSNPLLSAIEAVTGELSDANGNVLKGGRDLVKTPLTAFAFGSSLSGSIRAMEEKFIDSIYTKIEKMAEKDTDTSAFIAALNQLVSSQGMNGDMTAATAKEMLAHELDSHVEAALRAAFQEVMKQPVTETMNSYFATFIQRRSDLNSTIQAGFSMYEAAYAAAREEVIQGLLESDDIAYRIQSGGTEADGKGTKKIPLHELTAVQEEAIRDKLTAILPVAHTAYSMGGDLKQGIYMAKQESSLSNESLYQSVVKFVKDVKTSQRAKANSVGADLAPFVYHRRLSMKAMVSKEVSPGVAGTPYFIHSLDSALMHKALAAIEQSLNVHDEIGHNVLQIARAAGAINRATAETLLEFSPAREAFDMFQRITLAMAEGVKAGTVSQATAAKMVSELRVTIARRYPALSKEEVAGYNSSKLLEMASAMAWDNAVQADRVRLAALAQLGAVDQYVWEGGHYADEKAMAVIRAKAQEKLDKLDATFPAEFGAAIKTLTDFIGDTQLNEPVGVSEAPDTVPVLKIEGVDKAMVSEVVGKDVEAVTRKMDAISGSGLTPWGEIGDSPIEVNKAMQKAFEANPNMSGRDAIAMLVKHSTGVNQAIARKLLSVLPAQLTVQLITPDTPLDKVISVPDREAFGWYSEISNGDRAVYLKSADFRNHGMTIETLLHELVHVAVAMEIHAPSNKASKSIVDDLNDLLTYVKNYPGAEAFPEAVSNVQEFVAYGMTDAKFQEFMKQIVYPVSRTNRNRLVTAMKMFTQHLTKLLFGDTSDTKERALSILVHNVSGLMQQAQEGRKERMDLMLTAAVPAQGYSTADIYTELGQNANNPLSQEDDARLRTLLGSMIEVLAPIYGAFGKDAMSNQTLSPASIWANAQAGGQAPFALDAVAAGLAGNEQVAFMMEQVEVMVRAAISGADGQTSVAYRELVKLHSEAREKLKGQLPQSEYDFMFDMQAGSGNHSDYLSRFAALGLVNPKINALLRFSTEQSPNTTPATSFLGRLQAAFENVLEWLVGRWTHTHAGQRADSKLDTLATQLVMIEAKRRARLNVEQSKTMESIEQVFRSTAEGMRDKVDEWANADFFKKNKNGFMRLAGSMTSTVVKDRLDQLALAYQNFSDQHFHHSQGVVSGLVTELRGANASNKVFYKLLRMSKYLEGQRKDIITGTAKVALQSFANLGKDLTDEQKKAISNVFLRTDMAALLDRYDMKELRELLADQSKLAAAIVKVTEELGKPRHLMFYINAAKGLGFQMVTGAAKNANALQNAHAIARLYGSEHTAEVQPNVIAHTEPLIDVLASLYALHYTNGDVRSAALKVLDKEMARGKEGNGVEMVLKLHRQLQQESKSRLFEGQEALMMKGYTPEIYNPYIEMTVVAADDVEAMQEQGYGKGVKLTKAKADPEMDDKVLMARHGTGLQQHTTGTMSLTSMSSMGTTKHNGQTDLFSKQGQYNAMLMANINKRNKQAIEAMFRAPIEPENVEDTFLVPILNPNGEKVNYRYMMQHETKDNVLDRDSRFEKLLGTMAGSIFDKQSTPKQNRTVVEALAEQYKLESAQRPKSFIEVGPRSPDPEMREIYRLLPESTKQSIREVWKADTMYVRIDLLDINFGYRKLSLADALQKDRAARQGWDKMMGEIVGFAFTGKLLSQYADEKDSRNRDAKATVRIRQFEEMWQSLVREAKDILVIKSVSTLIGNTTSNISLLYGYGVPLTDVMRHHRIAFRGAVAYKRDSDELFALQTKLDTGMSGNVSEDKKRVVQLKDAMAKNPVHELIEAGLMPTIVEDIELDDDIYSFKSKFVKRVSDMSDSVNPGIKAVAKQLYMAHDTKMYKALSQAAQLSDFLGRYTLYQHMTTKKRDPMSKEDAIQLASDAFINYDVPTHRKMQYMNDMGFFRFTKYYLRVQKVIMHLYRENPGRMLALMGMTSYFDQVPTLLDSSMVTRLGNPLEAGAFTYLDAPENLATFKLMSAPFK